MRLLVLSPFAPPPDGIGRHSQHLIDEWEKQGHSVTVLAPHAAQPSDVEHYGRAARVHRVLAVCSTRHANALLDAYRPDQVIVQFSIGAYGIRVFSLLRFCAQLRRQGFLVTTIFHEPAREVTLLGPLSRWIYARAGKQCDTAVALSATGVAALEKYNLGPRSARVLTGHGTQQNPLPTPLELRALREKYQLVHPYVLALGFTHVDKGIDHLIAATPSIAREYSGTFEVLIAGKPRARHGVFKIFERRDKKYLRTLQRQARDTRQKIRFTGYVDEKDFLPLLRNADVVALPYRAITQSGIAHAALSAGAVIVASDLPGLRDDLGDAAAFVPAGDVQNLGLAIARRLGPKNAALRKQWREKAHRRAVATSFATVARDIVEKPGTIVVTTESAATT